MLDNSFKIRPYRIVECGGFVAAFYRKKLEITAESGKWLVRVASNTPAYDRLLDAAIRNLIESHNPPRTLTPDEIRKYGVQLDRVY